MDTPVLLRPLSLRGVTLRNRIVISPMCQYSAACAVFSTRDVVAAAEAPERGHAHVSAFSGKLVLQFRQGDIRDLGQRGMDQLGIGLGPMREPVAALGFWPGVAACGSGGVPSDGAGRADAEALGGFAAG